MRGLDRLGRIEVAKTDLGMTVPKLAGARGLSMGVLAEQAGIALNTLKKIYRNTGCIRPGIVIALGKFLETSPDVLLGAGPPPARTADLHAVTSEGLDRNGDGDPPQNGQVQDSAKDAPDLVHAANLTALDQHTVVQDPDGAESDSVMEAPQNGSPSDGGQVMHGVRLLTTLRTHSRQVVIGAGLIGALLLLLMTIPPDWPRSGLKAAGTDYDVQVQGGHVEIRDAVSKELLWEWTYKADVLDWLILKRPGASSVLLLGMSGDGPDGGLLRAVDTDGWKQRIWATPDYALLRRYFGSERAEASAYSCEDVELADLAGDGELFIVCQFVQMSHLPAFIATLSGEGRVVGTYLNWGHLRRMRIGDLNQDGREEILAVGVHNGGPFDAPTLILLDLEHLNGAACDPDFMPVPEGFSDGALVRVVLCRPQTDDLLRFLGTQRLDPKELWILPNGHGKHVLLQVWGDSQTPLLFAVDFDTDLRPIPGRAYFDGPWHQRFQDAIAQGRLTVDPTEGDYLPALIGRVVRYEGGHRVQ